MICGANPSYCEAHHIISWLAGGPTDIDNLALVCGRHHHQLHDHNQTLIKEPDSNWHTQPRAGPTSNQNSANQRAAA